MKIERLLFQVNPPEFAKDFILSDSQVWNPWLVRQPGFIRKEHRIPSRGLVEVLVFWKSIDDMHKAAEKHQEIETVEAMMRNRTPGTYRLMSSS